MRVGLVGTGHWAQLTHAPAVAAGEHTTLTAVWGRDARRAADLAAQHGATAHTDVDAFLAEVDAVSFAVPPDVQAGIALRAAAAGKHLLLEKPVALDLHTAQQVEKAVEAAGVASVVFFTNLFRPEVRDWLAATRAAGSWRVGRAVMLSSAALAGPFATPWRQEHGALWDLGPHALGWLTTVLGPVTSVRAFGQASELTHLALEHEGGGVSTAVVDLTTPPDAATSSVRFWGPAGETSPPAGPTSTIDALRLALRELVEAAALAPEQRPTHLYGVQFGTAVVDVLDRAQRQLGGSPAPDRRFRT